MKIIPIIAHKYNQKSASPNFKNNLKFSKKDIDSFESVHKTPYEKGRVLYYGTDKIYNRQKTYFLRNDLDWKELGFYLDKKYNNNKKVNIIDYACSNGLEAYSISLALQQNEKDTSKFFPIIAKDINKELIIENIENQSKKKVSISGIEPYTIAKNTFFMYNDEISKYLTVEDEKEYTTILKNKTIKPVKFEYGNILNDIKNIDSNNPTVIFARNVWPYIDSIEYDNYAKALYDKLANNSIVIIGAFDIENSNYLDDTYTISDALCKAGFIPTYKLGAQGRIPYNKSIIFEKL